MSWFKRIGLSDDGREQKALFLVTTESAGAFVCDWMGLTPVAGTFVLECSLGDHRWTLHEINRPRIEILWRGVEVPVESGPALLKRK